ncbi:hypothetical protein P280DRAFT_429940 [Massarina eburnea CBS 473.64]|uniref:Intramembrane protease 2 n=1 Tax=Massarina eburnea CBS 473.64 TaxID=1395130 RepID=A0A6A6RWF6_9PLEO|nr:hypothetical protein P280DRAFT_429940 [Massarina eburnea CBS 473.64]
MDDAGDPWARIAQTFSEIQPFIPTYTHLILSALFPIYAGAHASLTRPSSAAKSAKKVRKPSDALRSEPDSDSEEEEEEEHKMEGLAPTDAIMMPLFAGLTLAGLYALIKWLEDPALLNKLLNGYFALFGVFSVSKLITDVLDIGHSLIFPHRYALGGALYHVRPKEKGAVPVAGNTNGKKAIESPLPGLLAKIPLTNGLRNLLWNDRAMPGNKWTLRLYLHRIVAGKALIGPHGVVGAVASILAVAYFNFVDKPWYLTNLMGFGFSYGALQLMSPTTFATGSLILGALFFYDIYFVFYTPMMVTVAKSLDVPIKLVFPRPAPADDPTGKPGHAMLGLGDVVLPGIMIGLALRFDLFLFYLRRQTRKQGASASEETVEKPKYHSLAGRWSDHFWTHSLLTGSPLFKTSEVKSKETDKTEAPFTFPKTYFKASLVGYVTGMLCTLGVMHIWGHAQPALLYLVPGVLGSLWLTAIARGELNAMWEFSEAYEEEDETTTGTKSDSKDGEKKSTPERSSFFSLSDSKAQEREDRARKALSKHVQVDSESEGETEGKSKVKDVAGHRAEREVLSFSIEAPWKLKSPRSVGEKKSRRENSNWAPTDEKALGKENEVPEPSGKRLRLRK